MLATNEIDHLLRRRGLKKISDIAQTAKGNNHTFDNEFIQAFDLYLSATVNNDMTKSQYNNITLFIKYADGLIDQSDPHYERLFECDKYLSTIGEI